MSSSYSELKADIKCWERMFERQHSRKPTKTDVKQAAPEIQKCYKDYMILKKCNAVTASSGNDIFGADLNKPKEVEINDKEKGNLFVPVTPNLRKKIDIKNMNKDFSKDTLKEETLIANLGFDTSMSIADDVSKNIGCGKTRNVFSRRSAAVLKALQENQSPNVSVQPNTASVENRTKDFVDNDAHVPLVCNKTKTTESGLSSDVFELSEENSNGKRSSKKDFGTLSENTLASEVPSQSGSSTVNSSFPQNSAHSLEINQDLLNHSQTAKKRKITRAPEEEANKSEENFVRLNMKSKKYRRPGAHLTGEAHKRKQWKSRGLFGKGPPKDFKNPNKKPPNPKFSKNAKPGKCFKCGEEGHWANKCTGPTPKKVVEMTPDQIVEREALDFASLEPMMTLGASNPVVEDDIYYAQDIAVCGPVLDGSETEEVVERLLQQGLSDLGYDSFRPGQREAALRVLQGKSTLLVLATGSGKSLVYQLCAYLYFQRYSAITLVISPLISLMDDQIQSLPAKLPGKCLHSHMSVKQKQALKEDIANKLVPLLLLSPEGLMAGSYGTLPPVHQMPPIGLVCIDEAHCLSSWSDNFRPAYLRVCDVLRSRYRVRRFLGLTATCTNASSNAVCKFIGVTDDEGVLKGPVIRDNLYVTASFDQDKDRALVSLLQGARFRELGSIIVYCTRREQCERVGTLLRTSLPHWAPDQEELCSKGKRKRKALENSTAESYHAGLSPSMRSRVQHHFMCGTLRIVCATVAFGMGLDKANVRSVIHYSMPKSFENYVQEIGRAGRDGRPAHCHVFVDEMGGDLAELSRHAHANVVDRYSVRLLLSHIFKPCACATLAKLQHHKMQEQKQDTDKIPQHCVVDKIVDQIEDKDKIDDQAELDKDKKELDALDDKAELDAFDALLEQDTEDYANLELEEVKKCPGHSVTFPIDRLVQDVDVPEENIATMLTYLELCPSRSWLTVKRPVNATCHVQCYGGPAHLTALAKQATTILAALKFYTDRDAPTNQLEFPYIELAARMGWDPFIVRRELRDLAKRVIPGYKLAVHVEFTDLSFHVNAPGNLSDEETDQVTDYLHERVCAQKNAEVRRLRELHQSLLDIALSTHYDAADEVDKEKDAVLKETINVYFSVTTEDADSDWAGVPPPLPPAHILACVQREVRSFIQKYQDLPLRGRVIARVFQGIGSPNYPALTWGRIRQFWRRHIDIDFDWLVRCATEEIAAMRRL